MIGLIAVMILAIYQMIITSNNLLWLVDDNFESSPSYSPPTPSSTTTSATNMGLLLNDDYQALVVSHTPLPTPSSASTKARSSPSSQLIITKKQ